MNSLCDWTDVHEGNVCTLMDVYFSTVEKLKGRLLDPRKNWFIPEPLKSNFQYGQSAFDRA